MSQVKGGYRYVGCTTASHLDVKERKGSQNIVEARQGVLRVKRTYYPAEELG